MKQRRSLLVAAPYVLLALLELGFVLGAADAFGRMRDYGPDATVLAYSKMGGWGSVPAENVAWLDLFCAISLAALALREGWKRRPVILAADTTAIPKQVQNGSRRKKRRTGRVRDRRAPKA